MPTYVNDDFAIIDTNNSTERKLKQVFRNILIIENCINKFRYDLFKHHMNESSSSIINFSFVLSFDIQPRCQQVITIHILTNGFLINQNIVDR